MEEIVEGYVALFQGNRKAYGQWNPQRGSMKTDMGDFVENGKVKEHLTGVMGLGLVPVRDDATCMFGVIDIDNHDGKTIDLMDLSNRVASAALPLVVCRSKSGGAHCYLFCKEPVPAYMIRKVLTKWAGDLKHEKAEIFPKQSKLEEGQIGNWINLPYFGALSDPSIEDPTMATNRYAMEGGKPIRIEAFIQSATLKRVNKESIESFLVVDHPGAPPCIQSIMKGAISKGYRNQAIYALTVYMRQAFPSDFREKIYAMNPVIFDSPLSFVEVKRTVASASKKDYMYKCGEDPCKSLCDLTVCRTRDFGVGLGEKLMSHFPEQPMFSDLKVFKTDPPVWEIKINGKPIVVNTSILYNNYLLAQAALEKAFVVVPPMKNTEWLNILAKLMTEVETEDAPDEASVSGIIRSKLHEFILRSGYERMEKHEESDGMDLYRGMPIVRAFNHRKVIMFRGVDFVDYLKKIRFEELKGTALWLALKAIGVNHGRTRMKGHVTNVWYVDLDDRNRTPLDPDFKCYTEQDMQTMEDGDFSENQGQPNIELMEKGGKKPIIDF